jgi:transcriptional regulator with XRE-family HTH domain
LAQQWKTIKHKFTAEEHAAIKKEAHAELERIGFGKLRQARQQTQIAVAERLKIPQGAVSRMEKRSDLLLSTLREYVGALGGKLELRAVFPDANFELETLAETTSAKKRPARAVAKSSAASQRHGSPVRSER